MNQQARIIHITPQSNRLTILPIELHYSKSAGDGFCRRTFRSIINRLLNEPDTYAVFPGDVTNSDRPSMRDRQAIAYSDSGRESARLEADEDSRTALEHTLIKELEPVKHKILGMLDGDHFKIYKNGFTSTRHICHSLKIPEAYLGERVGWIKLVIHRHNDPKNAIFFNVFVRHGKGSCATIGSDINKLVKQSSVGFLADLYIGGHTHRKWIYSEPSAYIDRTGKIRWKPIGWARAGNLLRSYGPGKTTYPEAAELPPLPVGYPDIYLELGRAGENKDRGIEVRSIRGLS